MGDDKLRLLLLFSFVVLSTAQDEGAPCLMARRYKAFNKYEYLYETESLNGLNEQVNGPKASCKVEIAVPSACSYILRVTDCKLSEVTDFDANGDPVLGKAATAEDFRTAIEKNPLKFTVKGDDEIKLFPEEGERTNILNIKRGIISALAVPVLEEDRNKEMATIYGLCKTEYTVNQREDIATEITLNRDLSSCDKFKPIEDHTSPLALITDLSYPLAQLIRSNQTCNYKFDKKQHHLTAGICTEKHVLVPFSYKGEYGVTNTGKQVLTLLGVTKVNDRLFDHNVANMKPLHLDYSVDISPVQDKVAALAVLKELADLSNTNNGRKRAHLAYKLVAVIRKMEAETLIAALPEALEISRSLTYQALLQCGTPKCSRAIMQIIRTFDKSSFETDAAVYAIGIIPRSSRVLVKEMLETAKFKPSRPVYYALSNAVRRLYETDGVTSEIKEVADYALEQLGDCTGDQEHVFLSLRVIGNMMAALGSALPALQSAVIQCINEPKASPAIQQAAIQVYRQFSVPEEGREVFMNVILDRDMLVQKRIAAYLILMKNPTPSELVQLAAALEIEKNNQAKSFIISHISSILSSTASETLNLRQNVQNAFMGNAIGMETTQFSRHYRLGSFEGNFIFESPSNLPREVMLEMTLNAFGLDLDLIEIGMEGKGFEPIVEALFGDDGFFPDVIMKSILYATDKMPAELNEVWDNMLPNMNNFRKKRQVTQNIVKEISNNVNKLFEDLKAQDAPEAMIYLKLMGAELGYLDIKDSKMIHSLLKMVPNDFTRRLFSSVDNELFLHYIFMDNEFYLPTGGGFPLRVALSGTFTPGIKGGFTFKPGMGAFEFLLSAGIEFVTEIGTHLPDYIHSGLEMHTNIYHESGLSAKISGIKGQLKLSIPVPREPNELFSVTNSLVSIVGGKILPVSANDNFNYMDECTPLLPGLKRCITLKYPDVALSKTAPYFPLTGDSRFAVEIRPSGTATEYTATINYAYEDEEDKLTFSVKAEGTPVEAINTVKINRKQKAVSAKLLIKPLQLDYTVSGKYTNAEKLELESDLKLPGTTSVQTLILKYVSESEKVEAEVKSEVSSEARTLIPIMNAIDNIFISLLDRQMGQNEMKVRDILVKLAAYSRVPADLDITFPKKLFLNVEAAAKYQFGQQYYTIALPLPFGGKSTRELNFLPTSLSTPDLLAVDLGLEFESTSIDLPEIFIPESAVLSLPAFEKAELSGKVRSNLYNLDSAISAARDPDAHSSYSAKFEVTGTSPRDLLSLGLEGSALVEATPGNSLKSSIKAVVRHGIFNATISVEEEVESAEKLSAKSKSKLEVTSLIADQISLEHNTTFEIDNEKISGAGNLKGFFKAGTIYGSGTLEQSVLLIPSKVEAKIESMMKVDSTLLQAQNFFAVGFANEELIILSMNSAFEDVLTQITKIAIKKSQIDLNFYTKSKAFGLKMQNSAETSANADAISVKIETSTDFSEERIYSLLTGALDVNGLDIKSDASVKLMGHRASHKAILSFNEDGLTTNGTTFLQSILTGEEAKHTFEIIYKSLTTTVQCRTLGSIMGASIDHNTEVDIDKDSGRITSLLRLESSYLNVEWNTKGTTVPLSLNFDAKADGNSHLYLSGHCSVEFDAKVNLKVDPQSFTHSHECKISTLVDIYSMLIDSVYVESKLETKSDSLLTPLDKKATVAVKAEVNKHGIHQEISAYNTPPQFGMEGSVTMFTNLFNTINTDYQELVASAFMKYDKRNEMHLVNLPFVDNLYVVPYNILITYRRIDDILRNYVATRILSLPRHVSTFVSNLNFERIAEQLKRALKIENLVGDRFTDSLSDFKQLTVKFLLIENVDEILPKYINSLIFLITKEFELFLSKVETPYYATLSNRKLQIPESTLSFPCFGKLHGGIKFNSPVYAISTSAEFKNTSEPFNPLFTGFIKSKGSFANFDVLNYNLDSTFQISVPERNPVTVFETLKLTHTYLALDQEASLTLNVTTAYNPDMSSLYLETILKNQVNSPTYSLSSKVILNQKAVAVYRNDAEIILSVKNTGTGKLVFEDFLDEGTHNSDLNFNMGLSTAKLSVNSRTDRTALQMTVKANADAVAFSHLQFNAFVETTSPFIKNSLLVASGKVCINEMEIKINATHETEFIGIVSGVLSNTANIVACPSEIAVDFQNKGNAKSNLYEFFLTSVDLQNDYAVIFNPGIQSISTVAVAQLNNYKYRHNFTASNNEADIGVHAVAYSEGSLGLFTAAEKIVPVVLKNAVDNTIWYAFTTTEQPMDLNAKLVYKKTWITINPDFVVPLGNLVSEVSLVSSIVNLNANAGIYPNDFLMRISSTSDSAFEELKSKLDGVISLTGESGLKLASSLSLENARIGGKHSSSLTLKDNYEAILAADTVANINLSRFSMNSTHQLFADTKDRPKAESNFKIKYSFIHTVSEVVGYGDAENTLKMNASLSCIAIESLTQITTNSTFSDEFTLEGTLGNEANIWMNVEGLKSNLKTTGIGHFDFRNAKLWFDIDDRVTLEGDFKRIFYLLEIDSNYTFAERKEKYALKHTALGKTNIVPLSTLIAAVDFFLTQPGSKDFEYRGEGFSYNEDKSSLDSQVFSRWFNSSTALSVVPFDNVTRKGYVLECSFNFTSPSLLVEYESELSQTPI